MSFRLCDGLSGVGEEEADVISIAGMGGETITEILAAAPWTKSGEKLLLLQPMSAQPELRSWLQSHGYVICREVLSKEGDTLYVTFQVTAGQMVPLSAGELWAGRQQQSDNAPLRAEYLDRLMTQSSRALEGLRRSARAAEDGRLAEMERLYQDLLHLKEEWATWQQ